MKACAAKSFGHSSVAPSRSGALCTSTTTVTSPTRATTSSLDQSEEYNNLRPHRALNMMTPRDFADRYMLEAK